MYEKPDDKKIAYWKNKKLYKKENVTYTVSHNSTQYLCSLFNINTEQ